MLLKNIFNAFKKAAGFIIPLFIILSISAISYFHLLDNYELVSLDYRFILRHKMPASDRLVIVEIGEDSVKKLGRFPFDRKYHALIVNALSGFGAKAVVFDLLFTEPQEHDKELREAIAQAGNIYLPFAFNLDTDKRSAIIFANGYVANCLDELAMAAKGTGHINIVPDSDGKFRRVPLYIKYADKLYPYLSFLAGCDYLGIKAGSVRVEPGKYALCGNSLKIPLDEKSNMIINYSGKWGEVFKHYSYVDILQTYLAPLVGEKPFLNPDFFKDKICIIGLTTTGMDIHPSPFEPIYPGVGIHAEILNSLINKRFIMRLSREVNLAILLILGSLLALITFKTKPIKGLLIAISATALFLAVSIFLFDRFGMWIDVVCPVLVMGLIYMSIASYKYIGEWKGKIALGRELDIAKKIQESFLPKELPVISGIDMAVTMLTTRKVGGDLYDFVEFGPGKIGIMIGDVSGKGVPASLFMAMVAGTFKCFTTEDRLPEEVLAKLNSKLIKDSSSNLFVTIFYAVFDLKNNMLHYANGGHLPLMHLSNSEGLRFLDVDEGAPLGLMENPYSGRQIAFKSGDIFIFYTDGITEAMNPRGEMYERERLQSIVERVKSLSSKNILSAIEKDVARFEPKKIQHDDMTVIVVKIN